MTAMWRRALFVSVLAMPAASTPAHHSVLSFDGARGTTITGTVTRFVWQNPHTFIALDVARPDGAVEHWRIESDSPRILERLGWTEDSIAIGARLTVLGAAAKDRPSVMRCREIELGDGRRLPCF
jgi:hypothetical protein